MKIHKINTHFLWVCFILLNSCIGVDIVDDRMPFVVSPQNLPDESTGRSKINPIEIALNSSDTVFIVTNLKGEVVNEQLGWKVDSVNIATANNGIITGLREGESIMTIWNGEVRLQEDHIWYLRVVNFERIEINSATGIAGVSRNGTLQLSATYYNGNNITENTPIAWNSSNESIATVNADGLVTGIAVGQARITATATEQNNLIKDKLIAVVANGENTAVDVEIVNPSGNKSVEVGKTLKFNATAKNVNGDIINMTNFNWVSNNTNILTVDAQGLTSGIAVGTAEITASSGGISSDPYTINVITASVNERNGNFVRGRGSTKGSVTLFVDAEENNVLKVRLNQDFNGAGIPGPFLYLGNDADRVTSSDIEIAEIATGPGNNRTFVVPGNPDINAFNYVIYHCKPFNIIYGVFELE